MGARTIVITSGKGGVGKTTTTANLGTALASLGERVVLIDADLGLRNLDIVLGLENRIVYNIIDIVNGECKLEQAVVKDKRQANLGIIPAAQGVDKSAITPKQMQEICADLAEAPVFNGEKPTIIMIDCPAGIEQGFQNAIAAATEAIIVANPEVSSIRDSDRVVGLIEKAKITSGNKINKIELVVNRIRPKMVAKNDMLDVNDVKEILNIPLLGVIPDDETIIISTNEGKPAVTLDNSKAGEALNNIARRITGEEVPLLDLSDGQGFFHFFKKIFAAKR